MDIHKKGGFNQSVIAGIIGINEIDSIAVNLRKELGEDTSSFSDYLNNHL